MSLLVENIAKFCRNHPLEEKILVVPNRIVGRQLTDSVARELAPKGWINLRAETVGTLAHSVAGEEAAEQGRTTLSRAMILAIVEKICDEVLGDDSYFGRLRRSPGFHRALARTIQELRAAGLPEDSLTERQFAGAPKAEDLRKILRAYREEIARRFVDGPGLLRRATEMLRASKREPRHRLLVPEAPRIGGAEMEFLRLFAGSGFEPITVDSWREDDPPAANVEFFRALGEENELREVFRRALARKIPFDQIEILYSDRQSYLSLAYELTHQYGIPATFVDRIDVAYTRPGQAALGFLDWLASDFEERKLRKLVAGGLFQLPRLSGSETLKPLAAARILRDSAIGWGRERYLDCLDAHAAALHSRVFDPNAGDGGPDEFDSHREKALSDVTAVRAFIARLLAACPVPTASGDISLGDLARACADFVCEFASSTSTLDGVARTAIPRLLQDLASLEGVPEPLPIVAARVREAIVELFVGGSAVTYAWPGRLHFAGFEDGGYTGRRHTFIVGLDESRHPGAGLQDPVLLDEEREVLNRTLSPGEVPLRGEGPLERARSLRDCVARLRGTVTLSYSSRDLSDDREQFPSPVLLEVFRRAEGKVRAEPEALQARMGTPAGFFSGSAALDEAEWWLSRIRSVGISPADAAAFVHASYPWLEQGGIARRARASASFTVYDGLLPSAGTSLDPRESGEVMSASRFEKMADCPFAYFVEYVLGIKPPEDLERDEWAWLDAAQVGTLLHEVFRRFLEQIIREGRKPSAERDRLRLLEIAEGEIARWGQRIPPPSPLARDRRRREIHRACETFLSSEERETASLTPAYFEVPFGWPGRKSDCPGSGVEPARITVGGGDALLLRGSIDRVDRRDDGGYEVWDYKTGSAYGFDPTSGLDGGRRLQHAAYAAVLEELLRRGGRPARVMRAGYVFVGPRGDGHREDFGFDRRELQETLQSLCDQMREGNFRHGTDEGECCAFCRFEAVCGGREVASEAALRKTQAQGGGGGRASARSEDDR